MSVNLHHVHLVTAHIDRFCGFFIGHFGATVVFDDLIDGDRNVFLTIGTGRIHLFESKQSPPQGRNVFHHIGLLIDQLAEHVDELRRAGVTVSDVTSVPGGGFAMAEGPDGLMLELFEVTSPKHRGFFIAET